MSNNWNGGSYWIRPEKRLAIYARDGLACVYCGAEDRLSLDHIQPRELGGTHHETNLVTACISCNSARRDMGLRPWFAILRDKGIDTSKLSRKIKVLTARPLDRKLGKAMLAARKPGVVA